MCGLNHVCRWWAHSVTVHSRRVAMWRSWEMLPVGVGRFLLECLKPERPCTSPVGRAQ